MTETEVKLYSLSTCSHCKNTKRFLDKVGIQYDFVDVDLLKGDEQKKMLEEVKQLNPRCTFPTLLINGTVLVGFHEEKMKAILGDK